MNLHPGGSPFCLSIHRYGTGSPVSISPHIDQSISDAILWPLNTLFNCFRLFCSASLALFPLVLANCSKICLPHKRCRELYLFFRSAIHVDNVNDLFSNCNRISSIGSNSVGFAEISFTSPQSNAVTFLKFNCYLFESTYDKVYGIL